MHAGLIERFAFFDCVVVLSDCVRQHVAPHLGRVEVIPHGFDRARFHRVDRAAARAALQLPPDAFIVLNANSNDPRKRLDITREGFARFAANKPDAMLQLHPGEVDDATLNLLYNACDAGINTASGEGWGMISFEHAATGAAQIVPGAWVCGETWRDHAELLTLAGEQPPPGRYNREAVMSVDSVANALERLYADRAYREEMSARAFALAARPEYQWTSIARQWDALLRAIIAERESHGRPVAVSR
jgi:glycosyltransferase involved in cell wall biosynthesis